MDLVAKPVVLKRTFPAWDADLFQMREESVGVIIDEVKWKAYKFKALGRSL